MNTQKSHKELIMNDKTPHGNDIFEHYKKEDGILNGDKRSGGPAGCYVTGPVFAASGGPHAEIRTDAGFRSGEQV
jgi:hypothetical protein